MKRMIQSAGCRLAVPVVLALSFVFYWVCVQWIFPLPFYYQPDPQMAYFVDSLSPFSGHGYRYLDHPNITINVIGSLIYVCTFPLTVRGPDSFVLYHLKDPDVFFGAARFVLAFLHAGTVLWMARRITRNASWLESLGGASLAVLYFVLHSKAIQTSQVWTQDAFYFPFGTAFLLLVFLMMKDRTSPIRRRHVVLVGIGCGALVATHLLYSTYVVGIGIAVVLYGRWTGLNIGNIARDLFAGAGSLLATLSILLMPAASEIPRSLVWWWGLVSTRGRYGGYGPIAPIDQFMENLAMVSVLPELFLGSAVVVLIVGAGLFSSRNACTRHPGATALAVGLLAQLVFSYGLLLVVKSDTNMRYFLIIASVLPILLAVGLTLLSEFDRVSAGLHIGLALVVLPLFLANLSRAIDVRDRLGQRFEEITTLRDRLVSAYATSIGRSPETLRIIWGQGGPALWSPCAALWYGDAHASSTGEGAVALPSFSEEIAELCPNQRMLFQHRSLHVPGTGWVTLEEIEEDDEIDVAWDLVLESDASVAASPLFAGASVVEHDGCGIVFIGRQTNTGVEQEQGESR